MSDFNRIRYRAVIRVFDTGECFATADTQLNDCCIRWGCAVICHSKTLGCRVPSRQKKLRMWTQVKTSVRSCLRGKLSCCGNCCSAKSSSQCASDSRHNGHKHRSSKDDLAPILLMTNVCARWVPRMLDQKMKDFWRETLSENLKFMQLNWNLFVKRIVTGNETWIHHDDPETKQPSMQWKHASSPSPLKFCKGIGWQDNVYCFLGCRRYTANWLYASQSDCYRGLLCWFTSQTSCCNCTEAPRKVDQGAATPARQCICLQVTCLTSHCTWMQVWRNAPQGRSSRSGRSGSCRTNVAAHI